MSRPSVFCDVARNPLIRLALPSLALATQT